MKKKIVCLVLFSLIVSCKNSNPVVGKTNLPFESRSFSVNVTGFKESNLRKKLLHEIYLSKKDLLQSDKFKIQEADLEDIKDDENYNKNFAKLIVSYAGREELYYIPEGVNKEDLFSALNLDLEKGKTWVWKAKLKKGETAYLIETNPREVLDNEKNFSVSSASVSEVIYPFQMIEVSLQILVATPTYTSESITVKIPGCERDPELGNSCRCSYTRSIPSGAYSPYSNYTKKNIEGIVTLNQQQLPMLFHAENTVYTAQIFPGAEETEVSVFKIALPSSEAFQFVSSAKRCVGGTHEQVFELKNQFQYKMSYKIFGVNETLDSFGKLPVQI